MRVTVQISVDRAEEEPLLQLYRASIAPLGDTAAGIQQYTDDEFRRELRTESVIKLIGRGADNTPQALSLIATDLSTVPWVSRAFYAKRFPDHHARGAIFYVSAIVVQPDSQGAGFAQMLMKEITRITAEPDGVCAFDCANANREIIPALALHVSEQFASIDPIEIDSQHFYAYVTSELRHEAFEGDDREIDLRTRAEREATGVDLAGFEDTETASPLLPSPDTGAQQ